MKDKFNINSIAILLIGLLVVSGGIYGGYQLLKKETFSQSNSVNTNSTTQSSTQNLEDGWIKYENKEYGISFETPTEWKNDINGNKNGDSLTFLTKKLNNECIETQDNPCAFIIVSLLFNSLQSSSTNENLTIETWFNRLGTHDDFGEFWNIIERKSITIDNFNAWKLKNISLNRENGFIEVFNSEEDYILNIRVYPFESFNDKKVIRIINTISLE